MKGTLEKFDITKEEDRDAAIFESTFGMFERKGQAQRNDALKQPHQSYYQKQEKREREEKDRRQ